MTGWPRSTCARTWSRSRSGFRVPGSGSRGTDGLEFRAFYGVLREMGRELRWRSVTHVVTEASGVCADPVCYALAGLDFEEVMVVNPARAKALKGHEADANDSDAIRSFERSHTRRPSLAKPAPQASQCAKICLVSLTA